MKTPIHSSHPKAGIMVLIWLLFVMLVLASSLVFAQSFPNRTNAIYLEGNGNALTFSLNYEREVSPSLYFRAGLGVLAGQVQSGGGDIMLAGIPVPLMLNYCVGQAHALELGLGATVFVGALQARRLGTNENVNFAGASFMPTSTIGYRYRSEESGFMLRAGLMPYYVGDVIASAFIGNSRRVQGFLGNPVLSASGFGIAVGASIGWTF